MSAASPLILTALLPRVPLQVTLLERSSVSLSFKWQPPVDSGGVEITAYNIYQAKDSNTFVKVLNAPATVNPSITVYVDSSVLAATAFTFKVSASNEVGEGPLSDEIYVIAADMPQQPSNPPTITLVTQTSITLTIAALPDASNGGSAVTGYIIESDDGFGGAFQTV